MPHALISVPMADWPKLQRIIQGYELEFQLLPDLEPEQLVAEAKRRRPVTRRPRRKPLVWKFSCKVSPFIQGQHGSCRQCGVGHAIKGQRGTDAFMNPHSAGGTEYWLCAGCTAVHLTSLLHAVPHAGEHAPFGDFHPERNIPYAAIRERLAQLRGEVQEAS